MVGIKGKSGRKADPLTEYRRYGKKTLYIRQTKNQKGEWVDDPTFQWFKMHYGSRWQDVIRSFMRRSVMEIKETKYWQCNKCPNVGMLGNYHHNRVPKCPKCGQFKNKLMERYYG